MKRQAIASRGPWVRAALNALGIAAALAGVYFAFLTSGAIWNLVLLLRGMFTQPSGPGGLAALIAGLLSFVFVVVLGTLTGVFLVVAAWALEPRRRWRRWRGTASDGLELPPP